MTAGHAWSDWLEVGDADLDNDHHLQMRLVSSLVDALEEGRPWLAHRLVAHLRSASEAHFDEEEQRMRRHGDPERAAHLKEHDALLALMDELRDEVEGGDAARAVAAALDLRSTLAAHIATSDRRLAAREHGLAGEPAAASP
jgi:hemerythrin